MSDIRTFIKEIYQRFTKSLIHVTYYCQVGPCFDFKFLSAITSVRPHWDQIKRSNENTAVTSFILSVGSAFRLRRCRPQGFPKNNKQQTNNKKAQRPWGDHLNQTQLLEKRNPISRCADQSHNQVIRPSFYDVVWCHKHHCVARELHKCNGLILSQLCTPTPLHNPARNTWLCLNEASEWWANFSDEY